MNDNTAANKSTCKTAAYEKLYDAMFAAIASPMDGQEHTWGEKYDMLQSSRIYDCERKNSQQKKDPTDVVVGGRG